MSDLFHTYIFTPLYNGLVYLVDILPGHDLGLAVIVLTICVRVILFPLAKRAIKTQIAMKEVAPEIEALKVKHKDDPQEQARATFELYRTRGIKPFSSFFLLLIQLPILFGLYAVFARSGLPSVDPGVLYAFVPSPESVSVHFLGLLDITERSIVLALLAGLTQVVYARLSMGPRKPRPEGGTFSSDLAHNFELQARYMLPAMITVFAYIASSAVALYLVTSNLFMIGQEFWMGRRFTDSGKST